MVSQSTQTLEGKQSGWTDLPLNPHSKATLAMSPSEEAHSAREVIPAMVPSHREKYSKHDESSSDVMGE